MKQRALRLMDGGWRRQRCSGVLMQKLTRSIVLLMLVLGLNALVTRLSTGFSLATIDRTAKR